MNQPRVYMCSPSWTLLPPPSPSHLSGSSQCTSPEHPVSCIEPGLAICFTYDNIHVSVLFSQIIPPLPSPTESKRLFYTSVFLPWEPHEQYGKGFSTAPTQRPGSVKTIVMVIITLEDSLEEEMSTHSSIFFFVCVCVCNLIWFIFIYFFIFFIDFY